MSSQDSSQSESGAKRGRIETSPNLRPITPGGAKLGDWMQDIQAQIDKLGTTIKNFEGRFDIHKIGVCKMTRESETKTNERIAAIEEKISQILGRMDKLQDTAKESTDYVNGEIEEVRSMKAKIESVEKIFDKVESYEHRCSELKKVKREAELRDKKINTVSESVKELKTVHRKEIDKLIQCNREAMEKLQKVFEEKVKEASQQALDKAEVKSTKSAANGIFFTGLANIRKREGLNDGDITAVVHNVLHKVGSSPYYTDVVAIHPKNSPRNAAENIIVYFQSTYHKNFAAAEIWRYLAKEGLKGTVVRDLFLPEVLETSRRLTAKGFELKKRGLVGKFCVDNILEQPVMFVAKRGGRYERVSDMQIDVMLKQDVNMDTN